MSKKRTLFPLSLSLAQRAIDSATRPHLCQNCGRSWKVEKLGEIQNLWQRVMPGELCPSGECPKCGALCHPESSPVVIIVEGGMVQHVASLPPGLAYEVIDWDVFDSEPLEAWGRLSEAGQAYVRAECPDEYKGIQAELRAAKRRAR